MISIQSDILNEQGNKIIKTSRILPIILLIGTVLRLYQLGTESVWTDEMLSIRAAENFWGQINFARPLYFFLLNLWMNFGSSDIYLRMPSVLFGIGCIFLIYCLGTKLINQPTGLVAAFMVAVSPLFINHSQEIRMYSLSSFLSLAGTLALCQGLSTPRPSNVTIWAVSRWLAILTTPLNSLLLAPDFLIFSYRWFRYPRKWLLFISGVLFTVLGSLPTFYAQVAGGQASSFMEGEVASYSKPGLLQILGMIFQICNYWPLRYLTEKSQLHLANNELNDSSLINNLVSYNNFELLLYAILALILIGVFCFSITLIFGQYKPSSFIKLAAWSLIPSVAILGVSSLSSSIWFPRYLLGFAPYAILLLAAGFVSLWRWRVLGILISGLYIVGVLGSLRDYYGPFLYRNDWQGVASEISAEIQAGKADKTTVIYYSVPKFYKYSFPRYYQDKEVFVINHVPENFRLDVELDSILKDSHSRISSELDVWVVCWPHCFRPNRVDELVNTFSEKGFYLKQERKFKSLELGLPIKAFLFTPTVE